MRKLLMAVLLAVGPVGASAGEEAVVHDYDGSFDDALFELETAIVDRGLVVDHVSRVGEMLNRTAKDVGATEKLFDRAEVHQFCSAILSRKVMEADPMNIAHCPYGIFLIEREGKVQLGYRTMPDGPMQEVEALFQEIAQEVVGE